MSARLFAALAFTPAEKRELAEVGRTLRAHCDAGRFPPETLLHITLHFFGQTPWERLGDIESAMRQAAAAATPFMMTTGRAGAFGRRGASVLWLGVENGATELKALQASLERALAGQGFPVESRPFQAHISLARDVQFRGNPGDIPLSPVTLRADAITLLESTQAGGRLEYVPVVAVKLGE